MSLSESCSCPDISEKRRRKRTVITPDQLDRLEASFKEDPWPNRNKKEMVAKELDKTEPFVSIWFQNKRARVKREEEMTKQSLNGELLSLSEKALSVSLIMDAVTLGAQPGLAGLARPRLGHDLQQEDTTRPKSNSTISDEVKMGNNSIKWPQIRRPEDDFSHVVTRPAFVKNEETRSTSFHGAAPNRIGRAKFRSQTAEGSSVVNPRTRVLDSRVATTGNQTPVVAAIQEGKTRGLEESVEPATDGSTVTLFEAILNMMAVCEGGILHPSQHQFQSTINDSLYGIMINGDSRLVYNKVVGLDLVDLEPQPESSDEKHEKSTASLYEQLILAPDRISTSSL